MVYIYAFLGRLMLYPYLAYKLSRLLPREPSRWANRLFLIEFILSSLSLLIHRFVMHDVMSAIMDVNLYIFFGVGYVGAFVLMLNLLQIIVERISKRRLSDILALKLRHRLDWAVAGLSILIFALVLAEGYRAGHHTQVRTYGLNEELADEEKIRIVLVTDLHIGEGVGLSHVRRVVDLVEAQRPDLILFGGDYIDHDGKYARDPRIIQEMKRLKAPDGVYFVPGNHEYRADSTAKLDWVRELGFTLLVDSIAYPPSGMYSIIGRDDYVHRDTRKPLSTLLKNLQARPYNILLEHTPEELDSLSGTPIDYALYGHTHAGQLWPYKYILHLKYAVPYGTARYGDTEVIVSSGAGAAGTLFRLGTDSEIVLLTLRRKTQDDDTRQ